MLHVTGKANTVTRVVFDSFGQNSYPLLAGRMGRGSAATPASIANNDIMMRIVGNGTQALSSQVLVQQKLISLQQKTSVTQTVEQESNSGIHEQVQIRFKELHHLMLMKFLSVVMLLHKRFYIYT
jgi:hypothetical protein